MISKNELREIDRQVASKLPNYNLVSKKAYPKHYTTNLNHCLEMLKKVCETKDYRWKIYNTESNHVTFALYKNKFAIDTDLRIVTCEYKYLPLEVCKPLLRVNNE